MSNEDETAAKPERLTFKKGVRWEGDDPKEQAEAIDAAFDYRGNVTIFLRTGEDLCGYISNRNSSVAEPFLEIFPKDSGPVRRVAYSQVRGLEFTGRDTASGRSWEAWVKRYEEKKAAEARGKKVRSIDMFPDDGED